MPWKLPTWKGLTGLLALASSIITVLTVTPNTLPHSYEAALAVAGGVLIAVERWADAIDNQTATNAPQPAPAPAAVPSVPLGQYTVTVNPHTAA